MKKDINRITFFNFLSILLLKHRKVAPHLCAALRA